MSMFISLIRKDAYIPLNKQLAKLLGNDTAILYCELASRYCYFEEKNMLTSDGWFFNTVEDLGEETNISDKTQKKCIDKLARLGFLEVKKMGLPHKRYFRLNLDDMDIKRIIEKLKIEKGLKSNVGEIRRRDRKFTTTASEKSDDVIGETTVYNNHNVITKSNNQNLIISSKKNSKNSSAPKTKKEVNIKHARKERDRELKTWFYENVWERYPKQHRVGETLCFSRVKSAINNGSSQEEIIKGFNTYLKVIEMNKRNGTEQYIKRLDNWFAAESWKNPNKYMKSQMDKKIEQTFLKANKYKDIPRVFMEGYDTEPLIDLEKLARASEDLLLNQN